MLGLIPESLETNQGESLTARTASLAQFRYLGPPDLVQLTKTTKSKVSSAYHFVTGVDVSSPAAIAAHFNILSYALGETQVWFGRAPQWKVSGGTYCCWNIFSGVDVRVTVDIPGGTEAFLVYPHQGGLTRKISELSDEEQEQLWLQVAMSAFIRALILTDDDAYLMEKCRHDDPIASLDDVQRFIDIFEALYFQGPTLGADSSVQNASFDSNWMVDALFQVLNATGYYKPAIEALQRLGDRDPSARVLLVRIYLLAHREVDAVSMMVNCVQKDPHNAPMLAAEAEFLLKKSKAPDATDRPEVLDLALDCALRATEAAPSDFYVWELLTKVYIEREQWDEALLSLNSCPLIPSHGLDTQRLPSPKRVHCPLPTDGVIEEVWALDPSSKDEEDKADPQLVRLPAAHLRGSTARAYALLAAIYGKLDWFRLMQVRSEVFLMELESKASAEAKPAAATTQAGTDSSEGAQQPEPESVAETTAAPPATEGSTTDSNETKETTPETNATDEEDAKPDENNSEENKSAEAAGPQEPKPAEAEHTLTEEERAAAPSKSVGTQAAYRTIRSKRLCERRIDNLFMVLYDDVRAYSNWQREAVHFQSQQLAYNKTAHEWELFGFVAQRGHHDDVAKDAYMKSLRIKFSYRILWKLLEYAAPADADVYQDTTLVIDIVVKLMAWNHRWYTEFSPRLSQVLRNVVAQEDIKIIRLELEARYGGPDAQKGVMSIVEAHLKRVERMQEAKPDAAASAA